MGSIETGSTRVLKAFIAGANADYRAAGLSEYQMRVRSDGTVDTPNRPSAAARAAVAPVPAAPTTPTAGTNGAAAGAASVPAGPAPKITAVSSPGDDAVKLAWTPVAGAVKYGIWQNGQLLGSVPDPSFAARIAASSKSALQVDAELEGGRRTQRSAAVLVVRQASGPPQTKVVDVEAAAASAAQPAATAPEAATG